MPFTLYTVTHALPIILSNLFNSLLSSYSLLTIVLNLFTRISVIFITKAKACNISTTRVTSRLVIDNNLVVNIIVDVWV